MTEKTATTPTDPTKVLARAGSGASCDFYKVGMKTYYNAGERDDAFDRQTRAYEGGIAPLPIARSR
jgi:hypothetical protein